MREIFMDSENFKSLEISFGKFYLPILTATILLTSFTMITYGTIVSVAVPNVMGTFGVGQDKAQLLATGFYVAMTISQLICAWLIASIGHYYTYIIATLIFFSASLLGASADDFSIVITSRVIQGASAGILLNQTNIAIVQAYPPQRRAAALIMFTCSTISAMGAGPLLGGLAIEYINWRYIFIAPLPLLVISFLLGMLVFPKGKQINYLPFDWLGLILLTICLSSLLMALSDGQRQGWHSNYIISLFLLSVISGSFFIHFQINNKVRLLDLSFFSNSTYLFSTLILFFTSMGNFGAIYLIPIFARIVQGFSPIDAGFIMFPASILTIIILPIMSKYSIYISPRPACMIGLLLFVFGTYSLALSDNRTPIIWMIIFVTFTRLGIGISNPFVAKSAISEISLDKLTKAMSTLNFFRILGTSIGTTIFVVFLDIRTIFHNSSLAHTQVPSNDSTVYTIQKLTDIFKGMGLPNIITEGFALEFLSQMIYLKGLNFAFQDGFIILTFIFILSLFLGVFISNKKN
jgi:DHA2 family multidrug resistance protein